MNSARIWLFAPLIGDVCQPALDGDILVAPNVRQTKVFVVEISEKNLNSWLWENMKVSF